MKNMLIKLLLSSCFLYINSANTSSYDPGGNVMGYYSMVIQGNKTHARVAIYGTCASACTEKLGSNNLCIDPSATLLFHQASDNGGARSAIASNMMLSMYPANIRNWAIRTGALNRNEVTQMTGFQAIRMGVPSCL